MKSLVGTKAKPYSLKDQNGKLHVYPNDSENWQLMVFHRHLG